MRKVLSILLPLFLFLAAAGDISEAAIDRDTVTRAWKRVSAQAGIEYKPVNFENKK
jgi:hypothetical protein